MQDILKEVKSYCSAQSVGRKRILYFLFWLYCKNHVRMKEIAYQLGIYHNATYSNVCHAILNNFLEFGLIKPKSKVINNAEVKIYEYHEPITDVVKEYLKVEKNWIETMTIKTDMYEF